MFHNLHHTITGMKQKHEGLWMMKPLKHHCCMNLQRKLGMHQYRHQPIFAVISQYRYQQKHYIQ